ncbi:MAG: riboflavin biosynthesis protein RibD, partial [Fusobacteriia bacterium 4572_132]
RGIEKMEKAGIKVIDGLLEKESRGINDVFMKFIENKEPFVFLKSAITLDGKIATKTGDSKWITNEKARNEVHKLRNRFMGIMVGIGTVLADNPNLTARIENGVNPYRIIIDPNLKTPLDANIIKNNEDKKTIICINKENQKSEKYIEMKEKNVTFLEFQGSKFKMKEVLGKIGELNIDSILVEGGAEVISNVIKENLVDSGVIFIAPKILGDSSAKSFVNGFDITKITDGRVLEVKEIKTYGDNIGIWFGGIKCLQD